MSFHFCSLLDVTRQGIFVGYGILAMNHWLLSGKMCNGGLPMLVCVVYETNESESFSLECSV